MSETQIAIRPKASQQLAASLGMEPGAMLDAIKAQCFKCDPSKITNEMLAAFVSVAAAMDVNPFLPDMLYAFPGPNGSIVPIMGPSGVYKKLMEHPEVDSWETEVFPADVSLPPTHATTKIWRKGRERPLSYTALVSEWRITQNPNWNTRCRHMISLRSLKHAARQIIHGLPYDADDRHIMEEINVTNTGGAQEQGEAVVQRKAPPERSKKGAAAVAENPKPAPAIDVQTTTPPAETKTEKLAKKLADPAEAKAAVEAAQTIIPGTEPETPPAAEAPKPRASLKDGEEFTAQCEVVEVATMMATFKGAPTPSVEVKLKGGFTGKVYHFGGATGEDEDNLTPLPVWAPGNTVDVTLLGKANKAKTGETAGKVLVRVQAVSVAEGVATAMEVD